MAIRVTLGYFHHSRIRQVIIVIVGDDYCINNGDVTDLAWHLRITPRSHPGERRAAVLEYWVEENSKPAGKFGKITCMP
jgi:hypothetical protein